MVHAISCSFGSFSLKTVTSKDLALFKALTLGNLSHGTGACLCLKNSCLVWCSSKWPKSLFYNLRQHMWLQRRGQFMPEKMKFFMETRSKFRIKENHMSWKANNSNIKMKSALITEIKNNGLHSSAFTLKPVMLQL